MFNEWCLESLQGVSQEQEDIPSKDNIDRDVLNNIIVDEVEY